MTSRTSAALRLLLFAGYLFGAPQLRGQQAPMVVHYPLRLVEVSVYADIAYGLQLVVQPAAKSGGLVWLRFDPDSVFEWLNRAAAVLRFAASGGPGDAIQWSPNLRPLDGRGGFLLGRHRKKGTLEKERYLAVADSAPGWQAEIAAQEADSILHLFLSLAPLARVDTSGGAAPDQSRVDRPATVLQQPKPSSHGTPARVAVQYVVGVDGQVEPGSLMVLVSPSAALETEASEIIRASRFAPARKAGQPVRQLVRQVIVWP